MNPIVVGVIGSVLLVVLLFFGMPIAFVMMFVGFLGISYLASINAALPVIGRTFYEVASYYPYTIIPLFNVYTIAGAAKDVPMEEIFRGALPFLISIITIVILITIFPKIALFLPGIMGR